MTLSVLASGGPIKKGISVAPVTDWHLYDTFYTEKFMQTPILNQEGYRVTSILGQITPEFTRQLLLIHGTGDDNVHFQHSAELNKVLVQNGIQYETMLYTNRNHGISGFGSRPHLYTMIENWLRQQD